MYVYCVFFFQFVLIVCCCVFFFKQKTADEMRISDWSSDVCSSDLHCCMPHCKPDRSQFTDHGPGDRFRSSCIFHTNASAVCGCGSSSQCRAWTIACPVSRTH